MNSSFEPVWQMLRPVPIIEIDFGNGNVVTRTQRGNIATYICLPDGQVVDVIPGVYDAENYVRALSRLHSLTNKLALQSPEERTALISSYHLSEGLKAFCGILASPLYLVARWFTKRANNLYIDSLANETLWRFGVHAMLARLPATTPDAITKRIYSDVLHCDLDDPYLGLGPALFRTYPFET